MGALPNPFPLFSLILLSAAVSPAATATAASADEPVSLLFPHPLQKNGLIASPSPPPQPAAPPPEEKPIYSPFRPSMAVVVGVLTTTFSITFLLLLYAKHCKRANAAVVAGFSRNPNSMIGAPATRKNSGIDQAVIESLPIFRFGSLSGQKDGLECAVCLNKFEPPEILRLLPKCKHAFHVECVDTWLDAHSTCPLCRYRVHPEDVLLQDVNIFLHPPPPLPPPSAAAVAAEADLEQGRKSAKGRIAGRVSGRHSSVGENRTGESSHRNPAMLRRSLDSKGTEPVAVGCFDRRSLDSKRTEPVAVGCFDRHRKDGLLLPEDKSNQNVNQSRFEHRIIVSPAAPVTMQRWSDGEASDLLYLRSEMIISDSRRYSVASLPPELKRQRRMGKLAGKGTGLMTMMADV